MHVRMLCCFRAGEQPVGRVVGRSNLFVAAEREALTKRVQGLEIGCVEFGE